MGEVYRARDPRLGRDVALKLLPDALATDEDHLRRLEREARTLAALNHPHIAQIYGFEQAGETSALVMELVEGEDLSERVARGPVPLDEALAIALQIAQALEAAHGQAITHRDLKPANVKLRPDGTVKVLDFGLARLDATRAARAQDPSGAVNDVAETLASPALMTAAGIILGTASYMSPEQARGRPVDQRTDIWAFGCVLYEMLTGRRPFSGATVTDVIAAVVTTEPDWSALPPETPPAIRRLLLRCLRKDPTQRLRDIGDARLEIADPIELEPADADVPVPGVAPSRQGRLGAAAAALVLTALAAGLWWGRTLAPAPTRWTGEQLGGPHTALSPKLSPDGQLLAFVTLEEGQSQVAVMQPGTATWTVLTHDRTKGLVYYFDWSRDGSRIFYSRDHHDDAIGIYSVPALGGEERLVLENASLPLTLPDGSLLVARRNAGGDDQLHRFWPSSGKLVTLPAVVTDFGSGEWSPVRVTPDGRRVVFGGWLVDATDRPPALYAADLEAMELEAGDLDAGSVRQLAPQTELQTAVSLAQPTNDEILFGTHEGDVFRLFRADLDGGPAVPLFMLPRRAPLDWAADGSVITTVGVRPVELLAIPWSSDPAGDPVGSSVERLPVVPAMTIRGVVSLSGGRYLVASRIGDHDRVLVVTRGRQPVPLVETSENTRFPVAAIGDREAIVTIGAEGSPDLAVVGTEDGRIVRRFASPAPEMSSLATSPDGNTLYYAAAGSIWATTADGGRAPTRLTPGDSLVVDPDTGDLVVKRNALGRFELVRLRPGSSTPEPIVVRGDLRPTFRELMPGSIRGGRLALVASSADAWHWHAAVLDLTTGELTTILRGDPSDFQYLTWGSDGEAVGLSATQQETLWRFRPVVD
jgi:eukaryotic-like serine/threonine-protein kinase